MKLNQVHDLLVNAGVKIDTTDFSSLSLMCGQYFGYIVFGLMLFSLAWAIYGSTKYASMHRNLTVWLLFGLYIPVAALSGAAMVVGAKALSYWKYHDIVATSEVDDEYLVVEEDTKISVIRNGVNASEFTQDYIRFDAVGEAVTIFQKPSE